MQEVKFKNSVEVYFELTIVNLCCGLRVGVLDV